MGRNTIFSHFHDLSVKNYLEEFDFSFISSDYSKKIIDLVKNSILEDPSTSLTEGGIIKEGWSEELDHWRNIHINFNKVLMEYEAEEREKTGRHGRFRPVFTDRGNQRYRGCR